VCKVNILYSMLDNEKNVFETILDMYISGNWKVTENLLNLTVPNINDLFLYTICNVNDESEVHFDIRKLENLASHIINEIENYNIK